MSNYPSSSINERGPTITETQVDALIKYMYENQIFARVEYEVRTSKRFNIKWANLAHTLNGLGPFRTDDQWRKLWSNLIQDVKKKNRLWAKWNAATGDKMTFFVPSELNDKEKLISSIIGQETSARLDVKEVGIGPALTPDNIEVNYNLIKGEDDDINGLETIYQSPPVEIMRQNQSEKRHIIIIVRRTKQPLESTPTTSSITKPVGNADITIQNKKKTECHPQLVNYEKFINSSNKAIENLNLTMASIKATFERQYICISDIKQLIQLSKQI